ncbi:MAG: AAA family ATPase [Planctomycetota bacterium]
MLLRAVFIRFYKSFNFDYLRKYDRRLSTEHEWEHVDGMFYPYVRIPIDERITTVVGANESGKTHLLTAIEKGLSGSRIERDDFCRYSQFFAVEEGKMRWPDFGFEWTGLSDDDRKALAAACGAELPLRLDRFLLFRTNRTDLTVYVPSGAGHTAHTVTKPKALLAVLPSVFRLRENVALPESVPIRFLADDDRPASGLATLPRGQRVGLMDSVLSHFDWFQSKETVTSSAEKIAVEMKTLVSIDSADAEGAADRDRRAAERNLARDLIRKVAKVDAEALTELLKALSEGRDAYANSVIDKINDDLQARLNFPRWWVQDREFRLLVSPREYDLVFTIRDRTEKEYAFGERSSGLRYFLSYYIQYLAHEHRTDGREILLMDEPDAFLSNQGQQDLLKIFDAFANPDGKDSSPIQLVYVTHSPFLIDKNHGDRIRVLEKGVGEEGTRVVRDASRNHYEPLRSAFGSFVGETTFIGNCNLIVEGPSDQILLAGAASHLRSTDAPEIENLDLNHITIVPASGAPHVPYLVYLARGRDVEKPALVVLLDSDGAGDEAMRGILRGGPKRKELLKPGCILQLGDLSKGSKVVAPGGKALVDSEDLVPLDICVAATQRYVQDVCAASPETVGKITGDAILKKAAAGEGIFGAIQKALSNIDADLHIEKIGFARSVIETVAALAARPKEDAKAAASLRAFETNMRALFRRLRQMQRDAERELTAERVSARVNRAKAAFLQDRSTEAKREHAFVLFEEIEGALDNSEEADAIRMELQSLRREFKIDEDPAEPINDYARFRELLERMRYAGRLATQSPTLQEVAASQPVQHAPSTTDSSAAPTPPVAAVPQATEAQEPEVSASH